MRSAPYRGSALATRQLFPGKQHKRPAVGGNFDAQPSGIFESSRVRLHAAPFLIQSSEDLVRGPSPRGRWPDSNCVSFDTRKGRFASAK